MHNYASNMKHKIKTTVTVCLLALLGAEMSAADNIPYSPEPHQPLRVAFDYYHHSLPSIKVGKYILTGSWEDNNGRYGWNDFVHTNTFDHAYMLLEDDYQISMSREPYSKKMLSQTDIAVIIYADNPEISPETPLLSDDEITHLKEFVEAGGSLMVMVNAGSLARKHEGFEQEQLGKLVQTFGLEWNDNDTHYSDIQIPEGHPYFYDVPTFHYGAGCTLNVLPNASKTEVLLHVYSDSTFTDRDVKGPGIILVHPGNGKFMLVGDAGSWTANMSRPWADNARLFKQMFQYLQPGKNVNPPQFQEGKTLNYEVRISGLQAVPVKNSLSQIELPHYKLYSPREITNMPYFERTAGLALKCIEINDERAAKMELKINDFRWFDEQPDECGNQLITFTASRQGKVSGINSKGYDAQWLAPDVPNLIALLPVDGLRPGDKWNSMEMLRIPLLRSSDIPPTKPYDMEIKYVCDTKFDGKNCRLIRSSGEIWLDELGVTVEDLLPPEAVRQAGGSPYRFFSPQGGRLLFKREQWVDAATGIVLQAVYQTRVVAWIQDTRNPIPTPYNNADKDNEMIVSIAYISHITLKE